ncbi:MAG: sulfotransferase family 2 domain-containing protein [Sedimenticola sp.]
MPYIESKNLLFVHIPKNAGKSVEIALGLSDSHRLNRLGSRSLFSRASKLLLNMSANREARRTLHGTIDVSLCAQHLTLQEMELLNLIPCGESDMLRSFAICRNPWDRATSTYRHFSSETEHTKEGFQEFCKNWYSLDSGSHNQLAHKRQQVDFVLDCRGDLGVDRVLRFESLASDFLNMCEEWGLGEISLPHAGKQTDSSDYRDLYTAVSREVIESMYKDDIEFFDYSF